MSSSPSSRRPGAVDSSRQNLPSNQRHQDPQVIMTSQSMSGDNSNLFTYRLPSKSPECGTSISIQRPASGGSRNLVSTTTSAPSTSRDLWQIVAGTDNSNNLQVQPLEVRQTTDGQRIYTEHGQKMVVDGDAYTLVILECSPHPDNQLQCGSAASGEFANSCCCHSRCHCASTELIVKQVPCDHNCTINCQHHQQQQQVNLPLTIQEAPAISNQSTFQETTVESRRNFQDINSSPAPAPQQRQQIRQSAMVEDNNNNQTNQQHLTRQQTRQTTLTETNIHSGWQKQRDAQEQFTDQDLYYRNLNQEPQFRIQPRSPQQPASNQDLYQQEQVLIQHYERMLNEDPKPRQPVPQIKEHLSPTMAETGSSQSPSQQQRRSRSPRGPTKIVKKWDWNQAQFVETEVPDRPSPKPQITGGPRSPSTQRHIYSTDAWHQEVIPSTSAAPKPQDPGWYSYRIPDEDSVQTDPLYKDLMLELQRLEEGVKTVVSEPVIEYEQQKPVFGQRIKPESIEIREYEPAEFVCRIIPNSDPSMKVEWTLNGEPVRESSRIINEFEFGVARLRINRCEAEDSGLYQCRASNSLGEAMCSSTLRVHAESSIQCGTLNPAGLDKIMQLENPKRVDQIVEKPAQQAPKFITHITDYLEKKEGDSVHFECCLGPVDDPDLKTEWFFNGRPLVNGSRFHCIDDFGFIVMDIDWVYPRDTGEYVCRATNKHGTDMTRSVLRVIPGKSIVLDSQIDNPNLIDKLHQLEFPEVEHERPVEEKERPAHFLQHLKSYGDKFEFIEGEDAHFEARVGPATDGTLTVEWYHNDKPLISGHRFRPSFDFGFIQLDILYVYPEDSGVYKCVARNAGGVDTSQIEIHVTGKQSIVYQTQLPKEMEDGVRKLAEMEANWNRPVEDDDEKKEIPRAAPEFTLKPKPYTAFEGSCARFCCRMTANPRPRVTWVVNGQIVVSGSRYKLTYDGMYHLIIPKCQMTDAGKVEVYAKNPLGDCVAVTELQVRRKVDDYRGVLKNSPNPWYDEQSLKMYQRQRSQDLTDDEDYLAYAQKLKIATEQNSMSPGSNQVIGYMEPGTPDVNLLARTQSPLVEPGDLHPVVTEQRSIMAPAPSTIHRALDVKDAVKMPEQTFHQATSSDSARADASGQANRTAAGQNLDQEVDVIQTQTTTETKVFGLNLPRQQAAKTSVDRQKKDWHQVMGYQERQAKEKSESSSQQQQQQRSDLQGQAQSRTDERGFEHQYQQQQQQQHYDARLPPPSPESRVHGKEIHSHLHKQTQLERHPNREITREIIEKDIFEQEHSGFTKENIVRGSSMERGSTPTDARGSLKQQDQQQALTRQQLEGQKYRQATGQISEGEHVLIEEHMIPPEFIAKIQPCQALDGDEARFECTFIGDPKPTVTWFRESKMIKPSNLYNIVTDYNANKSTLIIKRVTLNSDAVYTVKAENNAGSAKSSANLVVEAHPLPGSVSSGGVGVSVAGAGSSASASTTTTTTTTVTSSSMLTDEQLGSSQNQNKVVKSVRTRKLSADEMATLVRASPEGELAPTFLHTIHDLVMKPGELARLDARLIGSQPMEVRWLKNGERIRSDKGYKMVLEGDLFTLLILECSPKDAGTYECVAANRVGEARCSAKLVVSETGRMSSTGTVTSGSFSMTSQSSSSSQQQQTSHSQQQQQHLQSGERTHFGPPKHQKRPLMGQYTPAGTTTSQQAPQLPKLIKRLENQQVREGQSVTLRCQISSFPIAEVHWYKHGSKLIKPSKYFRIFKDNDETYCLKILETFPEDQGEYRCVASAPNGHNYVDTKATITVIPNSPL